MATRAFLKKLVGVFLIALGLLLHIIPLFPAGWIIVAGLELVGIRLLLQDKIKDQYKKLKSKSWWPLGLLALISILNIS